ncbi:MAG: SPFH domain-containing protein [Christensenellaceae bacterium]
MPPEVVTTIVVVIVIALLIALIAVCCKVVPQASEYIVEFLGKYQTTWSAGLHIKIPFLQAISKKVTLKEQVLDSRPQPVITKDNVTISMDSVVYFRVFDSKLFAYGAVDPLNALENLAATTLRNLVGALDLDETLTSRDTINTQLAEILDTATDRWGIKVMRVELKNIMPPAEIRNAMEKQLKAERERRETLLQAEGHQQAVITRAEGDKRAMILEAEGERDARIARAEGEAKARLLQQQAEADALRYLREAAPDAAVLELKRYEALARLADGKAAKIIVPTDLTQLVAKGVAVNETVGIGDVTQTAPEEPVPEKPDVCCDDEVQTDETK